MSLKRNHSIKMGAIAILAVVSIFVICFWSLYFHSQDLGGLLNIFSLITGVSISFFVLLFAYCYFKGISLRTFPEFSDLDEGVIFAVKAKHASTEFKGKDLVWAYDPSNEKKTELILVPASPVVLKENAVYKKVREQVILLSHDASVFKE